MVVDNLNHVLTFFCGLALVFGSKGATLALLLNIWYIMALPLAGSAALITSVPGFLPGGLFILAKIVILSTLRKERPPPDLEKRDLPEVKPDIRALFSLESPILFSLVKALAFGNCDVCGMVLTGGHPFRVTFAPLAIIKPGLHQTAVGRIQRVAGTVLGGLAGFLLIALSRNQYCLNSSSSPVLS